MKTILSSFYLILRIRHSRNIITKLIPKSFRSPDIIPVTSMSSDSSCVSLLPHTSHLHSYYRHEQLTDNTKIFSGWWLPGNRRQKKETKSNEWLHTPMYLWMASKWGRMSQFIEVPSSVNHEITLLIRSTLLHKILPFKNKTMLPFFRIFLHR